MKFCTKCGKELFDEAVICPACGCATEQPFKPTVNSAPTKDIVALREFAEKATTMRNLGIVATVLMFGIGIIFSIIIWVMIPKLKRFSEMKPTNPLELAEFEAAKRKMQLGVNLSTMPILGIALSFVIGAIIGLAGMF